MNRLVLNAEAAVARDVARTARSSAAPLVPLRRAGAERPFFCCAAGFGDILALAQLANLLGPERPVYALQAAVPTRPEQPPSQQLDALVEAYLANLRAVQPRGPYLLGGNSSGGLLAYEAAQRLRARGQEVALLALLDAPPRVGTLGYGAHHLLARTIRRVMPHARPDAPAPFRVVRAMLNDDGLDRHMRALRGYAPRPYPGRVVLFHASGRYLGLRFTSPRPWRRLIGGELAVEMMPGDHITFLRGGHLEALGQRLRAHLDAVHDPA